MTTPSDKQLQARAKAALDRDLQNLTVQQRDDIADARYRVLRAAAEKRGNNGSSYIRQWQWLGAPVALALVAVVLVSYPSANHLPPMPLEMASVDMPAEELALLEDLDFVDWLASQPDDLGNGNDSTS